MTVIVPFVIPLEREDLLRADKLDQFVVREVYNIRELKNRIKEIEFEIQNIGSALSKSGRFDVFYSVISRFHEDLGENIKSSAHESLLCAMDHLIGRMDVVLNEEGDGRLECLNDAKMIVYLFSQLSELIERENTEKNCSGGLMPPPPQPSQFRSRKKSSAHGEEPSGFNWETSRMKTLTVLYRLLQLDINRLFNPPIAEEDFINCIANVCFRVIENPSISAHRNKNTRGSIAQILGTLNSRYDYSLSCSFKMIQELKMYEHVVIPLAEAVECSVKEFKVKTVVMEIVQEISRLCNKELSRDTSATRSYSQFLVEIAERLPEAMKPCLSLLITHLDGDSYMMRKSILAILGEIVAKVLSKEDLDDASKENRDQFLGYLEEHIHDVNAFVRSSVLAIWSKLCMLKAIPLSRQYSVLKFGMGRLLDKSCNVRKQAVQLLTSLLQCNPYTSSLPTEELEAQLNVESDKLKEMEKESEHQKRIKLWQDEKFESCLLELLETPEEDEGKANSEKVWENAAPGEISERIKHFLMRKEFSKALTLLRDAQDKFPQEFPSSGEVVAFLKDIFLSSSNDGCEENLIKQRILVAYLNDSVSFGNLMNDSLPIVCQLLRSKQSTDVLEAIDFFVTAFEFGLLNAMMGIRKMLSLIWSREGVVKEAVVKAYKRLYIDVGASSGGAKQVVRNLIALIKGSTLGELKSLEALIGMLVTSKDVGKDCFQILWQIFTLVMPDSSEDSSRDAITLLGMIGLEEPSVIISNIQVIIEHAFGDRGDCNFLLVSESCKALLKVVPPQKSDNIECPLRYDSDHSLFKSLHRIIVKGFSKVEDRYYIPMANQAISVIYQFSEHPDHLMEKISLEFLDCLTKNKMNTTMIKRVILVAGQIAACQLRHLDVAVFCELKRRNHLREMKLEKKQKRKSLIAVANCASKTPRGATDEEELVGAEVDDAEAEFIRNVCEKELVTGSNLLTLFVPIILEICSGADRDDDLRTAASLSLSKFMLVSNDFCDSHLRLFFTILEKSTSETTRANLIIAAGDLSVRFPNTLEPWTPRMYARLRDESALVRSNTLAVLMHLILKDMIKVKGQISDIALCIIDKVDKISSLAKVFFTTLARKGNSLYNVMPDIVSRLSSEEVGVSEEDFREIMKFIICLIEKDKHLESLVEKMCHRFRVTKTERQWRDLAYCLSLFSFNDKAIKKFSENFNCYSDKLYEEDVYASFSSILNQSKKNTKVETKSLIDELETKIEDAYKKGSEDHIASQRAQKANNIKTNDNKENKDSANEIHEKETDVEESQSIKEGNENPRESQSVNEGNENLKERRKTNSKNLDSDDEIVFTRSNRKKLRKREESSSNNTKSDEGCSKTESSPEKKNNSRTSSSTKRTVLRSAQKKNQDKNREISTDDDDEVILSPALRSSSQRSSKKQRLSFDKEKPARKEQNGNVDVCLEDKNDKGAPAAKKKRRSENEFNNDASPRLGREILNRVRKSTIHDKLLEKKQSPRANSTSLTLGRNPVVLLRNIQDQSMLRRSPRVLTSISQSSPNIEDSTRRCKTKTPDNKRLAPSSPGLHINKKEKLTTDVTSKEVKTPLSNPRNRLTRKR